MRDIPIKAVDDDLTSGEFNEIANELETCVTSSNQSLSAVDQTQISKGLAIYSSKHAYCIDSGTGGVSTYVLTTEAPFKVPPLTDGLMITFDPGNVYSGAAQVNFNSTGAKNLYNNGYPLAGGELTGETRIQYNLAADRYDLLHVEGSIFVEGFKAKTAVLAARNVGLLEYAHKSFDVSSQDTDPSGIFFKPDGLICYMIGNANNTIYQYTLSTAWDVSTASYASKSFGVSTQEGSPTGLFFKPDGLACYIVGFANDTIYQYTLSTAWDIATASYASKSFSVAAQSTIPRELFFKSDGASCYVLDGQTDTIYQYTISTPWDISTASFASKSFSVAAQDNNPQGLSFNGDGSALYCSGIANATIYQYTLSTAWDIATASFASKSFSVAAQDTLHGGLFCKADIDFCYIIGASDVIFQYNSGKFLHV